MSSHRPPAPVRPSRLWLGLMGAAVTGIVAGTVAAGHAAAPRVAADERLAVGPERTPELSGHGGIGGPLVIPSIGASGAWQPPEDSVRDETPHHAAPSARHQRVAVRPPTVTTAAGMAAPATTTTPEVTTSTPTPPSPQQPAVASTSVTTGSSPVVTSQPPTASNSTGTATDLSTDPTGTAIPPVPGTPELPAPTTDSSGSTAPDSAQEIGSP